MLSFLNKPAKKDVYCAFCSLGDSQMLQILTGAIAQGHTNTGNAISTFHREPSNEKTTQPAHYSTGKPLLIIIGKNEIRRTKEMLQEQEEGTLWPSPAGILHLQSQRLQRRDSCLLSCMLGWAHLYLSHLQPSLHIHIFRVFTGLQIGTFIKIHVVSIRFS